MKDSELYSKIPAVAAQYIRLIVKHMGWRKAVRTEVRDELISHFQDAIAPFTDPAQREQKAKELIAEFGDAKTLATLASRAKKRCRPMWLKVLIRTSQAAGLIFAYLLACSASLFIGKPAPTIDYVQVLNESVRKDHDPNQNAKPLLDEAARVLKQSARLSEILSSKTWPDDLNDADHKLLTTWLSENTEAINLFNKAAQRQCYWPTYTTDLLTPGTEPETELLEEKNNPLQVKTKTSAIIRPTFSRLSAYRQLARLIIADSLNKASTGDYVSAIDQSFALIRFSSQQASCGLLTEQLTGLGIEALGIYACLEMIDRTQVPPETIQRLSNKMAALPEPWIDLIAERFLYLDVIQNTYTDDGTGNGRLLDKGMPYITNDLRDTIFSLLTFGLPDKREAIAMVNFYYEELDKSITRIPWQLRDQDALANYYPPAMLNVHKPAIVKVSQIFWRARTGHRALQAILAVLNYHADHDSYPVSLSQLVESGYLQEIPLDPFANSQMKYKLTDNGFTLYSVGLDFKDDGGKIGMQNGLKNIWAEDGDAVFWPVQK